MPGVVRIVTIGQAPLVAGEARPRLHHPRDLAEQPHAIGRVAAGLDGVRRVERLVAVRQLHEVGLHEAAQLAHARLAGVLPAALDLIGVVVDAEDLGPKGIDGRTLEDGPTDASHAPTQLVARVAVVAAREPGPGAGDQLGQVEPRRLEGQLTAAKAAYEKALQVKKAFMREKDRKVKEAQRALATAKRAEWQSKVADAMESFQVGGLDATHDEMVGKLEQQSAVGRGGPIRSGQELHIV